MTLRKLLGYRPHPAFQTLTQEIYECGHVRSTAEGETPTAIGTYRRCIKCVKGMPAEVALPEADLVPLGDEEKPLVERMCMALMFHLRESEKTRRQMRGDMPELDEAIIEAHKALEAAGFRIKRIQAGKV
ncbi:MAG TPA: hypothetical protein ENJ01_03085 [Gammaproteobacteria bacterium]|nr:hypothetical protein [Gammaproteobacteria bacterium]